ncbi:MAG: LamG-like jellyroll fold domain-containing protein, partial [Candidatus Hodarchaeota archaeon]
MNRNKSRIVILTFLWLSIAFISSVIFAIPGKSTFSNDIIGRWHFDEGIGSDAYDSSGYDNHGMLSGGKFGNALNFDGINDYVEVPDDVSLDISGNITLEAWIYVNAFSTSEGYHMYIVSKDSFGQRSYGIGVDLNHYGGGNKPFVIIFHSLGGHKIAWGNNELETEVWYHIAGVYDISEDELILYVNNEPQTLEITSTNINTGSANLRIGAREYAGHQCFFNGLIDEVRISNIARTSFDLNNAPTADSDTVALWHFDESIGSTVYDETDNDNDGTIHESVWAGPTWKDGLFGKALYFDNSDYVSIDDSSSLDAIEDLSIELWLKPSITYTTGASDFYVFLSKYGPNSFQFVYHPAGYLYLWVNGGMAVRSTLVTLNVDTWYYLAATFESGTVESHIYVNDEDITADTISLVMNENNCPLLIGARPCPSPTYPKHFVQGTIDEVRIWNRILSVEEISEHSRGLVGEWDFDEGSDDMAYDTSGFGNDGTLNGDPMWVLGKYGTALKLDGNDYVKVPNDPSLNIGQGTWEAWLKFDAKPTEGTMMNPLAKANQYWIHASNGADDPFDDESIILPDSIQVKITVGGKRYIATTDANFIETGIWYHVAGTYDGDILSLYVNGELIDTNNNPSGSIDLQDPDLTIGTWSTLIDSFIGVVDEVRIWNRALTGEEILEYTFGLMGEWNFNEGSGSIAFDTSGFNNNGNLSGGKFGNGLYFDGINDYVEVSDSDLLEPTEITIEAWVNSLGSPGNFKYIISKYLPNKYMSYSSYGLYTGNSGGLRFYIGYDSGVIFSPDAGTGIWDGEWHHIAGTFDGTYVRLYVDNAQVNGPIYTAQEIYYFETGNLFIGAYHSTNLFFNGIIDEVRISNITRAFFDLTEAPSKDEHTVALWHFDESVGSIVYDETDNDNDGTIFEAEWVGPTWTDDGRYGKALDFDGVDDYVEIGDIGVTDDWTIEFWTKLDTDTKTIQYPIGIGPGTYYGSGIFMAFNWEGKRWGVYDGTNYILGSIVSTDVWYHIAVTKSGSLYTLYLNGVYENSGFLADVDIIDLQIGRRIYGGGTPGYTWYFDGIIDELRIWNKAMIPIKFTQTGLDDSATSELVVTVDDPIFLNYEDLPYVMMVRSSATVTYEYEDIVASSETGKRFRLGNPIGQNIIPVTEPTTIIGTYITQYEVSFAQTGLDDTATGTVITIDSIPLSKGDLPYTDWFDAGTEIEYEYENIVTSSETGKQFRLDNPIGLNLLTVIEPDSIVGAYITQYEVTFAQTGLDDTATGTVVTIDGTTKSKAELPYIDWFDFESEITYIYSNPVLSSEDDKQFWLTSVDGLPSPFIVTGPLTITGNYLALPFSEITTSELCYFDIEEELEGQQFRLIFTPNPKDPSHSTYKLTASNPGQFYYNIFYVGDPGEVSLKINIPYPFETQGANPVHVYSSVDISIDGCYIPSIEITGEFDFVMNALSNDGLELFISGNVPDSGLAYITIHLDYGLKKEIGFANALDDAQNYGDDGIFDTDDDWYISNYESYQFFYSDDTDEIDTEEIQNINVFKHDPGFAGLVLDGSDTPVSGVKVEIYDPDGCLLTTVFTDEDGFYFFYYKHKGKG